jgi:hypothetical protein
MYCRIILPIRLFLLPLCCEELDDGLGAGEETITVAPDGSLSIRFGDGSWVSFVVQSAPII